jgi:imidazole glycerol-phosphate synthase subunit HisH
MNCPLRKVSYKLEDLKISKLQHFLIFPFSDFQFMKTVLIDYGAGNLHSVYKALQKAHFSVLMTSNPTEAKDADALVLPGQGHFRQVMESFKGSGFEDVVRSHLAAHKPFLGICVGLQLLMESSEEAPGVPGLGAIKGTVKRFPDLDSVPQMGWNQITSHGQPKLLEGIPDGAFAYYANSYYVTFDDETLPGATTTYSGVTFKSAVSKGSLNATQFHPEKSQVVGLRILENFRHIAESHVDTSVAK